LDTTKIILLHLLTLTNWWRSAGLSYLNFTFFIGGGIYRAPSALLNCLYDISKFRDAADFSLDAVLHAVVDFIPPAIQYPEITCARLIFGGYEVKTKNFKDTRWKLSREITVNNKWIGTLEVCYLEEKPELDEGPFLEEAKNLIIAVAESIVKIIECEEAEADIRKHQDHMRLPLTYPSKKKPSPYETANTLSALFSISKRILILPVRPFSLGVHRKWQNLKHLLHQCSSPSRSQKA